MKCQILFSRKIRKNILKCSLLKFLPSMQSKCYSIIARDKAVFFFWFNQKVLRFGFIYIQENIHCKYSKVALTKILLPA